jgi:hypothetical protein
MTSSSYSLVGREPHSTFLSHYELIYCGIKEPRVLFVLGLCSESILNSYAVGEMQAPFSTFLWRIIFSLFQKVVPYSTALTKSTFLN